MQLILAKSAGFCYGVRRAVDAAESCASKKKTCVTLGPLIHNRAVVDSLSGKGVSPIDSIDEAPAGAAIIIRSHGVGRDTVEALSTKGAEVIDATCPFVARIHEMCDTAGKAAIPVIVVGEKTHPEVAGSIGWTRGMGITVLTAREARALPFTERALVVAQTTISKTHYDEICAILKKKIRSIDIRQTICPATSERQSEAAKIAKSVDCMLIVGGKNSANTKELYELCLRACPDTHWIESAEDLDGLHLRARDRIGITAGASTPDRAFKEVVARMNDIERQEQDQVTTQAEAEQVSQSQAPEAEGIEPQAEAAPEVAQAIEETPAPAEEPQETTESTEESDFMADVEKTLVQIRPGQTIVGTVVQISEDEVCVNVGYKADGLVKRADLSSTDVKIGDEIEVEVVKVNDGEGNVLLSQKNIVNRKHWDAIVAKSEAGEFVDGVGKEAVKGGLIANVDGIRAFIPASQLSQRYVERIEDFVGQEMKLKIIEVDKAKKRIVASRKAVLIEEEAEKKKAIWDTLTVGEVIKGTVRRLTDFGAFVDIGSVDGLVHVTDLSWGRVRHPSDVVKVNQEIEVKILNLDPERERISLSYKQTQARPWDLAGEKYIVGSVVEGKVVRITTFGAFVELEPGLDGLVHISQCALTRIAKVEDAVSVGDIIRVKILDVNTEARRISLSIRAVLEDEAFDGLGAEDALTDEFAIDESVPVASVSSDSLMEDMPADEPVEEPTPEVEAEAAVEEPAPEVEAEEAPAAEEAEADAAE